LSAHVIVAPQVDCHAARLAIERVLRADNITHTTLQVDHQEDVGAEHCEVAHGPVHRS
jgi:cobalt-zinc-cadmium efflux system protein